MSREFITMMLLWTLEFSIRKNIKHRMLIRKRFYRVLKPLHVMFYRPQWAHELLMSFLRMKKPPGLGFSLFFRISSLYSSNIFTFHIQHCTRVKYTG